MKKFLGIVCLFLIGCLSISVFSPEIHSSLFHAGDHCSHGKNGKPCNSHQKESSGNQGGSCAVVLFGESSEHFFIFSNFGSLMLPELGVLNIESGRNYLSDRVRSRSARGPPGLV